jgi:predicted AlkP superfamily pyrophosphatase or phosphodiesterase
VTTCEEARTSLGSHGFLAKLPKMNAMCILSGAGIRSGIKLQKVNNTAIAPTIARLLGLKYPGADGKPLLDALHISTDTD